MAEANKYARVGAAGGAVNTQVETREVILYGVQVQAGSTLDIFDTANGTTTNTEVLNFSAAGVFLELDVELKSGLYVQSTGTGGTVLYVAA